MPGPIPSGTSAAFGLVIQGVDVTRRVPSESVRITETAGDTNAVLEFDYEQLFSTAPDPSHFSWLTGLSQDVVLTDLTNSRRLFHGNVVNVRRSHTGSRNMAAHITCVSYDAWLDRLVLPSWTSKRANGTNMSTDREQIQNITAAVANSPPSFTAWDAINTYISSTNAAMPVVKLPNGGTARDIMSAVASAAATAADPTARNFYVDFDGHLHYFKGNEGLTAPYRIGDASYTATVKGTTGILSLVSFRETSGTAYDPYGVSTVTLNGGYTQGAASLVINEKFMPSITFNGTTGYASLAGASLHQADGPWSVELWVKRGATLGTAQTLVSAGATDYLIGFDTSNKLIVQKEGTGDHFVSTPAYTSTTAPMHIVVTRTGGAVTTVYVNGASVAGTTTSRTFVSAAGAVNIGRKLSTTNLFFTGTVQNFAFYSSALSAATVLAHYNDSQTIVADDFEFETDVNDAGAWVYVRGGTAAGTGWVSTSPANASYQQSFLIDRPESTTASLKSAIGTGFLKREANEIYGGRATITMPASTWRAGQTLTIDNSSLGVDGTVSGISQTYEIKQLNTYPEMGSGVCTYEIYFGALPWSGAFAVQRKKKRR